MRAAVRRHLTAGDAPDGWQLETSGAVRNAAWALGLVAAGSGWRPAIPRATDATLAIMARAADAEAAAALIRRLAFPRAVVLLDDADAAADLGRVLPEAVVAGHPLDGDFAAQRDRMQAMAATGWVLHLDSDEMPDAALLAAIGWLTAAADAEGLRALGLPRRNLVDGTLSDLYPDIQYRLVRADVRFAGRVHERPAVPFAATSLALAGALVHRLSGTRVRERTRHYGAMAADGARPDDEAALLCPYRDTAP